MEQESCICEKTRAATLDFDAAVDRFYEVLYRFAFGLTGKASDAADLTQDTFHTLLLKSGQIRDPRKLKGWLFSTLYRRFLVKCRRIRRFPEVNLEDTVGELPVIDADAVDRCDTNALLATLQSLEEKYRAPLVLHYLQELSYREIAGVLSIPIGTVMSRLSRGKDLLRHRLRSAWKSEVTTAPVEVLQPKAPLASGSFFSDKRSFASEPAWGV